MAQSVQSAEEALKPQRVRRGLPVYGRRLEHGALAEARDVDARFRPLYVVWEVTMACDLACRHCGSRAGRARPDELNTAECLDLIAQLDGLGVSEVTLIGGEAYLRSDFLELVRAIVGRGMSCSITTGGRGITPERARDMASAGIGTVAVSLDGDAEAHDRLRDVNGSHAAALAAIDNFAAAGIRPSVNTQINRLTWPTLDTVLDLLIEHKVQRWLPIMTVPMGRAADEPALLLQPYDLLEVFPQLVALKRRADAAGVLFLPSNNVGYFGPHEHFLRSHFRTNYAGTCGAGRVTMGIEADGSIKGCPGLPSDAYIGGNVREHSLREIWERGKPLRYTRDRTLEDLWGFCRGCYYAEECMSGCTWTSHVFFGRPGNNPYCHHRALELSGQGLRERLVKRVDAEGRPFDHGAFDIELERIPAPGGAAPLARAERGRDE